MLVCEGLHKYYGRKAALAGVDLRVRRGTIFGLLGPNGAGKSTLLKLITGLARPDDGAVHIDGFDVHSEREQALRRTGAVIEWPFFYPYLTARDNLRLFTGIRTRAFNERIEAAARMVGMEESLDRKVKTFSTGMKQRMGIAQAFLPDSQFIILDEPANGLDPLGIIELRRLLLELKNERGATILVSSHLLGEIEQVCDEVAILHRGKVVRAGAVDLLTSGGLLLVAATPPEQAARCLQEQNWRFERTPAGLFEVCVPADLAAEVNERLWQAGCRVSQLHYKQNSLEDSFLDIIRGADDVE